MPRLVRRAPWRERLWNAINPLDFLLWLSEEIETREWDPKVLGLQLGLGMNFVFFLARANSAGSDTADDVFGDDGSVVSWVTYLVRTGVSVYPRVPRAVLVTTVSYDANGLPAETGRVGAAIRVRR